MPLSVVVDDANLVSLAGLPPEHEPPLIVDADAVQPLQVATQSFETVLPRDHQLVESLRHVKHIQLPERDPQHIRR